MQKLDLARRVIRRDCRRDCHADVAQQEDQHEPMNLCGEPKEKEAVATQVFYVRLAHLLREFDDDMCTGVGWVGSSINIINIKAPIIIKCAMRGAEQRTPFPK